MEVGDDELALNEARTKLVPLDVVVNDGTKVFAGVNRAGSLAITGLALGRGLLVSPGLILPVVSALVLEIRGLGHKHT
jgi:hypothetical protein